MSTTRSLKDSAEHVEEAGEQLQEAGIKSLNRVTRATKTRIIYDKKHKILGLKNDRR